MQAPGQGPRPKLPRSAQGARNRPRTGKGSAAPGKRLYGLPTPFFAADVLPAGRVAVATRVAFQHDL